MAVFFISCKDRERLSVSKHEIIIEFHLENCNNKNTLYLIDDSNKLLDSISFYKKYEKLKITSDVPKRFFLSYEREIFQNNFKTFYFDNGLNKLFINCNKNVDSIKITGSKINDEYEQLQAGKYSINKALLYNNELLKFYTELVENSSSSSQDSIQKIISNLEIEREKLIEKSLKFELDFFKNKHNSFLAAYNLKLWITNSKAMLHMDEINLLHQNFSPAVKKSEESKILGEKINSFYKSTIGKRAPELDLYDISNNFISIKNNSGKYVLLYFWASWCAPCIEDFPKLKSFHQKYSNELKIIGISRDENLERWKNAILKYDIERWSQVSLKENNNSELHKKYFVNAIPTKVLIDPKGFIIGKWRGAGQENMNELEELLNQNLNQ